MDDHRSRSQTGLSRVKEKTFHLGYYTTEENAHCPPNLLRYIYSTTRVPTSLNGESFSPRQDPNRRSLKRPVSLSLSRFCGNKNFPPTLQQSSCRTILSRFVAPSSSVDPLHGLTLHSLGVRARGREQCPCGEKTKDPEFIEQEFSPYT